MNFIVVLGNPIDGLQFTGPFSSIDDAVAWAEEVCETDWWIVPLEEPRKEIAK